MIDNSNMKATCSHCGNIFDSNKIVIKNSTGVRMQDNFVSCPECGKLAELDEGYFDFDSEGLATLLSSFTNSELKKVETITAKAIEKGFDAGRFAEEIAKIDPNRLSRFAKLIELSRNENFRYWVTFLQRTIFAVLLGANINNTGHVNINLLPSSRKTITNKTETTTIIATSYSNKFEQELRTRQLQKAKEKKTKSKNDVTNKKKGRN